MTTTINAATSGGLISTADTSGILALQTAGTTAMTIDASQNVGIGTASPSFISGTGLVVSRSGGTATIQATRSDASTAGGVAIQSGNTQNNLASAGAKPLVITTDSTERMRIASDGKVGIGTTTMTNALNVAGAIQSSSTLVDIAVNTVALSQESSYARLAAFGPNSSTGGTLYLYSISSNGSVQNGAVIDSSGNFLVGTTSASNKFVVSAASGGTAVAQIINTTSSGNVISLSSTLQSNGNNTSSAHFQGNTNSVGNWYLFGNGTSSYSSDERLKKNIETTRNGYLEDLCKLRVVKYNWRLDEEGKNKELGLIAQEVEQVFPNLVQDDLNPVSQDDDTIYKQLKQSVLPFMLLKAIQELNAKVDAQAAEIQALKGAK